jgi:hypothetical protein
MWSGVSEVGVGRKRHEVKGWKGILEGSKIESKY